MNGRHAGQSHLVRDRQRQPREPQCHLPAALRELYHQDATAFSLNTESTYDWEHKQWQVPLNFGVGQVFKIGPQLLQFTAGARYWADAPDNGPTGWGYRLQLTLLFPN